MQHKPVCTADQCKRATNNLGKPGRHFNYAFSLDLGRPGSILARPAAPGPDFRSSQASIFELFRSSCAFGVHFVRNVQSIGRSCIFHTSELPRDNTKSTKSRTASMFDGVRCSERARTLLQAGPGASRRRPMVAFGRLLGVLGPPKASQDRPWGGLWASANRPERVWTCP